MHTEAIYGVATLRAEDLAARESTGLDLTTPAERAAAAAVTVVACELARLEPEQRDMAIHYLIGRAGAVIEAVEGGHDGI